MASRHTLRLRSLDENASAAVECGDGSHHDGARYSPALALLYDREKQRGNANRATLAVARKLVAYLVAMDRGQTHFLVVDRKVYAAA